MAASIVDPSGSNLCLSTRTFKGQIDPIVIAVPILSDEHSLVDAYGAPDLLDQASVVAVIIAEGGLEDASFVAAARMS
jgi:hypothetical protein